jgi:hypothetical protein
MMAALRQCLTEDDADRVFDPLRIAFLVGFVTFIALAVYDVVILGRAFAPLAYGGGLGGYLGGTGAALWAASKQEKGT